MDDVKWEKYLKLSYQLKIDRKKEVKYPPIALSMGRINQGGSSYDIPFGTYGNFSAIIGGSKAGKSYFKSLLIGAYIGGKATELAPDFKSHRQGNLEILDFDTEQGEWHATMGAKRIDNIVGQSYEHYHSYILRGLDFDERMEFIEYCIDKKHKNIGIVCIDGIADLISDVNSLMEANIVVQKLMEWTVKYKFHIMAILHTNWGSSKATGHLGSAVMKKAETVCELLRKNEETEVMFPYCRGFKIEKFEFRLNKEGLPYTSEAPF